MDGPIQLTNGGTYTTSTNFPAVQPGLQNPNYDPVGVLMKISVPVTIGAGGGGGQYLLKIQDSPDNATWTDRSVARAVSDDAGPSGNGQAGTIVFDAVLKNGPANIIGTQPSGLSLSFSDGETLTQQVTGATAIVSGAQSSSPIKVASVSGVPDAVHPWYGTNNNGIIPSGMPVTIGYVRLVLTISGSSPSITIGTVTMTPSFLMCVAANLINNDQTSAVFDPIAGFTEEAEAVFRGSPPYAGQLGSLRLSPLQPAAAQLLTQGGKYMLLLAKALA